VSGLLDDTLGRPPSRFVYAPGRAVDAIYHPPEAPDCSNGEYFDPWYAAQARRRQKKKEARLIEQRFESKGE
jgi:hypothetical protein